MSDSNSPGLSTVDYQFRDPWGNPYVITLDMNYDGKCDDAYYRQGNVSQWTGNPGIGYYGFTDTKDTGGSGNNYELSGSVMYFSMVVRDGKIVSPNGSGGSKANQGYNKDNVLGWQ